MSRYPYILATPENREAWAVKAADLATFPAILEHLSTGGTLTDLAEAWEVPVPLVLGWLRADPERLAAYDAVGLQQSDAWARRILDQVQRLGLYDARELFDEEGDLLPVDQWPAWAASAVIGLEVREERDLVDKSKVHRVTKVKLSPKLQALEMLGKQLGLFKERVEVEHTHRLAEGLKKARARAAAHTVDEQPRPPASIAAGGGGGAVSGGGSPAPHVLASFLPQNEISEAEVVLVSEEVAAAPAAREALSSDNPEDNL